MATRDDRWLDVLPLVVLVAIGAVVALYGLSSFWDDDVPRDAQVILGTFGVGMAIYGIALTLTGLRRGDRWSWFALWYYPVFFVVHVLAFGEVVIDLGLAFVSAVALLLAARGVFSRGDPAVEPARRLH